MTDRMDAVRHNETREHDVLIIGAGGAGLRAAVAAAEHGLSVGIVTKSLLGKAHTVMAEGGIAAAVGNVDRRFLAPALYRHHEERQVPEQLADGRDLHPRGTREGLRARAVGGALQPDT